MLKNERGEWVTSENDIESHIVGHFSDIFNSSSTIALDNEITSLFSSVITNDENAQLTRDVGDGYSSNEIP